MIENSGNGVTDFIICIKPTLHPIGKIGIWSGDEIGFILARSHWRQGLMSEALNTVLPYFFHEKGYNAVTADCDPKNVAVRRLFDKFGFVVTGSKEKTFLLGDV
jgi:[ribosomal protein S5]-alanine N-acetyltransferase